MSVFREAKFKLQKWHSNVPELETVGNVSEEQQESYAKEQLGVKAGETKMLGMVWNKTDDTLGVTFPEPCEQVTKRGILRSLASVFDPLGLVPLVTLTGKLIYQDACDQKLLWDTQPPENLLKRWRKWERELPEIIIVPRSLSCFREPTEAIDVHTFGDASGVGVSTAVYAVAHQKSGVNQGLIAANSCLAKESLTVPRLELASAHMVANLAVNATDALKGYPVRSVNGWTDSTMALHWIRGKENYKQFVHNRVMKIQAKSNIQWRHVITDENPADIGTRGCGASKLSELWWLGLKWLAEREQWPDDIQTIPTSETETEAKLVRDVLAIAVKVNDNLDQLMVNHTFWKAVRILPWVAWFLHNCKNKPKNFWVDL